MTRVVLEDAAHALARLTILLADALEGGDLAAAERIADEREALLEQCPPDGWSSEAPSEESSRLAALIVQAEGRGRQVLAREIYTLRAELTALLEGNRAMDRYRSSEPLGPGFVNRRD
jgi:hypothetical protein